MKIENKIVFKNILEILKILLFIFLLAHFQACVWNALAIFQNYYEPEKINWLKDKDLMDSAWT